MSNIEDLRKMMEKIREKHPDFTIVTATQPPKENSGFERKINFGNSEPHVIIIDHLNLIHDEKRNNS